VLDIAHLLRGGELLLSTGVAFPASDAELTQLVSHLVASEATGSPDGAGPAGLIVELGRRYPDALPPALLAAADELDLPVIELRRETSFVQVTEAVHALVVGAQLLALTAVRRGTPPLLA